MVPKPWEKYFPSLNSHQYIVQPHSTQRLATCTSVSALSGHQSGKHRISQCSCLPHQASPYSCWGGMPLGLSEHRKQLSVSATLSCCREHSALLPCRNQAMVVVCNSCHVHHKSSTKNRGESTASPFCPPQAQPCCFKVCHTPSAHLGKAFGTDV